MKLKTLLFLLFITFAATAQQTFSQAYSILVKAIANDNIEVVKSIVATDSTLVNYTDSVNWSPLHLACKLKSAEIARYLISKGANINLQTKEGLTPLAIACRLYGDEETFGVRSMELIKLLIKSGADVNICNNQLWSPLHGAILWRANDLAALLITSGANVNQKCANGGIYCGHTPLTLASERCMTKIVIQLLENGADMTIKTENGMAAIDFALKKGCSDVAELLKQTNGIK